MARERLAWHGTLRHERLAWHGTSYPNGFVMPKSGEEATSQFICQGYNYVGWMPTFNPSATQAQQKAGPALAQQATKTFFSPSAYQVELGPITKTSPMVGDITKVGQLGNDKWMTFHRGTTGLDSLVFGLEIGGIIVASVITVVVTAGAGIGLAVAGAAEAGAIVAIGGAGVGIAGVGAAGGSSCRRSAHASIRQPFIKSLLCGALSYSAT